MVLDKKKALTVVLFFVIAIIAISLRVMFLNTDFWYDEACSWFSAKQSFPGGIMHNLLTLDLQHTPLYFFLLHIWMKIFGQSEFAIKFLSLIFGIATVPLVYTSAKKISKEIAIPAVFVAAVSPLLVYFSTEARMYTVVTFLVMLSINYLIDFENKKDKKSLIKLVIANVLIPYTLVGGILYNISLWLCYGIYLFLRHKDVFKKYLRGFFTEILLLIPYFALVFYYAKMRGLFVVKHEGQMAFSAFVDAIRNFFGVTLSANIYWPSNEPYYVNFAFAMLVIVPCAYFVYGLVQCWKQSKDFEFTLLKICIIGFLLALLTASMEIHIFTVRYILFLLPPMLIMAIVGLSKKLSAKHLNIFVSLLVVCAVFANIHYYKNVKVLKTMAYKTVKQEADRLNLGVDDVVIMPFGADAPYYFRTLTSPRVFDFDFHKEVRNPYNDRYYDKAQQSKMATEEKYSLIYDAVYADKGFSETFFNYFVDNVNKTVPKGRYVLLALYAGDANLLITLQDLRKSVTSIQDVKKDTVGIMLAKYLYDIRAYLDADFNFLGNFQKDNYTYLLYQRR